MPNGKVAKFSPPTDDLKWDYKFENTIDKQGRIIQRKRFVDNELQDEITYKYNDKGLLIEKFVRMLSAQIDTREFFEYEFWD